MHNLCETIKPPPGTKTLLGLGLKFCVTTPKASPNIRDTLLKLAYRIQTKHYLINSNSETNQEFNPNCT